MAEIFCLKCKEMETFGENCKCFFHENRDKQYSKPRLDAVDLKYTEAKDENLPTAIGLGSEFQQIQLKDYENVNLLKNENAILNSDLKRIRKFVPLTDQTQMNGILENQNGHLNPPSKECELTVNKNDYPLILEENLRINSGAASHGTSSEINTFSTAVNFSVDANFCPANKNTDNNVNKQSEGNLTELLSSLEFSAQHVNKSKSMVRKVSESVESTKDSNTALGFHENNPDIIISQKRRFDPLATPGMFACKRKTDDYASSTRIKSYECDICKVIFYDRSFFMWHYKPHSATNLNVCVNSQKWMSYTDQLETHTLKKPVACNMCKKMFSKESSLTNHYRIHNKKTFVCVVCQKTFIYKSALDTHYRGHTNERPFVCNICEKGFSYKKTLVVHNRTHTGEKPFECNICKKRFRQRKGLKSHYQTHTNVKPFECDFCEKRFKYKDSLAFHRRKHTGEKSPCKM